MLQVSVGLNMHLCSTFHFNFMLCATQYTLPADSIAGLMPIKLEIRIVNDLGGTLAHSLKLTRWGLGKGGDNALFSD